MHVYACVDICICICIRIYICTDLRELSEDELQVLGPEARDDLVRVPPLVALALRLELD